MYANSDKKVQVTTLDVRPSHEDPHELTSEEVSKIIEHIFAYKDRTHFRKSWPIKWAPRHCSPLIKRAYYVWRWARFHGGVDTRLPMLASQIGDYDKDQDTLDILANIIAQSVFGTNMQGAIKWREILGIKPTHVKKGLRLILGSKVVHQTLVKKAS